MLIQLESLKSFVRSAVKPVGLSVSFSMSALKRAVYVTTAPPLTIDRAVGSCRKGFLSLSLRLNGKKGQGGQISGFGGG